MQFTTRQVKDIRRSVQISMISSDKTDLFSFLKTRFFDKKNYLFLFKIIQFII